MNKFAGLLVAFMIVLPTVAVAEEQAAPAGELQSFEQKLSYTLGLNLGMDLKTFDEVGVDIDYVFKGMQDSYAGKESLLTDEQLQAVQQEFAAKMQLVEQEKMAAMREKNTKIGAAYLAENKAKEGVVTTESGLQYEILKKGNGTKPVITDSVKVDYTATFVDGTVFDSTAKKGTPEIFEVGKIIPGWTEALLLMDVGSKYRLVIPSALGYGENGARHPADRRMFVIEPNTVLIFEVELHSIETPKE